MSWQSCRSTTPCRCAIFPEHQAGLFKVFCMFAGDHRIQPFACLNAEKTPLYRAVMSLFVEVKAHFEIHLRAVEVLKGLSNVGGSADEEGHDIEVALAQFCDWGNLRMTQDTSDVRTVEEFYRPRYLHQLTREGEAVERAVRAYEENVLRPGELQTAALDVIGDQLQSLLVYGQAPELDAGKIHFTLGVLKTYFDQLTTKTQVFIGSIQRAIDLHGYEFEVFIAYKEKIIEYLERFIGELVITASEISDVIHPIERAGVQRILKTAAQHEFVDAIGSDLDGVAQHEREWGLRWTGLKKWFVGGPEAPSQAETLRSCARSANPITGAFSSYGVTRPGLSPMCAVLRYSLARIPPSSMWR